RSEFEEFSVKRLIQEIKAKHELVKLNIPHLYMSIHPELNLDTKDKNTSIEVIIPRVDTAHLDFGLVALQHIENMGVPTVNSSQTIVTCKNKYLTNLALRKKKVPQPEAAMAFSAAEMLKHLTRMNKPFVLKMLHGSLGTGVSKLFNHQEAEDWINTFNALNQPLYIQEYVEHHGHDYRIMVLDKQVIGAEKRIAKPGQWKTNVSLGASVKNYLPPPEIKEIAIKSAEAVKGDLCGVDMIINKDRTHVLEVNCFPQFKGLEKATGKNIGRKIVEFAVKKAKQ
ncbi:MAG: RimK family alpha-L-glutamate ligase, partial [Candidatus Woesearchaeota archaeon]